MPDQISELPIERLRMTGLRPTRQRVALAELLFRRSITHFTAEEVHAEAVKNGVPISLATVYNTLHQFVQFGLLREVAIEGSKTYFDTKISDHFHFYFEKDGTLVDINPANIKVENLPKPPQGTEIARIDVLVRLTTAR